MEKGNSSFQSPPIAHRNHCGDQVVGQSRMRVVAASRGMDVAQPNSVYRICKSANIWHLIFLSNYQSYINLSVYKNISVLLSRVHPFDWHDISSLQSISIHWRTKMIKHVLAKLGASLHI